MKTLKNFFYYCPRLKYFSCIIEDLPQMNFLTKLNTLSEIEVVFTEDTFKSKYYNGIKRLAE